MLIHFIKFIHVSLSLMLLGSAVFCLVVMISKKFATAQLSRFDIIFQVNKLILLFAIFAMLTGTFLVYPKNFSFHTPWIQAAYLLGFIFCLGILFLIFFKKKIKNKIIWFCLYSFLLAILIAITHDAVTKTTFIF